MKKFLMVVNLFKKFSLKKLGLLIVSLALGFFIFTPHTAKAQNNPLDVEYRKNLGQFAADIISILFSGAYNPQGGELPADPESVHNLSLTPGSVTLPPILGTPIPFVPPSGYKYYAQCGGSFDSYPLPNGCNICKAGCGPTTVAMILASLVNSSINPPYVVNFYRSNNYYVGCDGSGYADARAAINGISSLQGKKLTTTDFLVYNNSTIDQVAKDFKGYLAAGWTLFALANYCENGCGHFFWIIKVDANNNAWAYDPYYGRNQAPPLNENKYYPFPRYRVAFGVKK